MNIFLDWLSFILELGDLIAPPVVTLTYPASPQIHKGLIGRPY